MDKNINAMERVETYLWESAKFLRNKIDAGDYKTYIFPLMFLKRISDVYDEEYQKALIESNGDEEYAKSEINHQFQIPKGFHWNDLKLVSKDVGQKILNCMREIEKSNPHQLYGIFGDANWGNKDRLSDETLIDLINHFSSLNLSNRNVPDDIMGKSYEFLIKKFADDSGHTAAEFYTNRTVVTLMTELVDPQPEDSIYDPTCGTGGMLLECVNHLKQDKRDFRTLKLYGQEKNLMTSGIARMNMILHGFEDAKIARGDTLSEPFFVSNDKLQKFDVILSNPPYSVSRWNRKAWNADPYGRNIYGTPPQKKADYAFVQHIISSMSESGRSAILLPHGILSSDSEIEIRKKIIEDDKLDAIIGLAKDLFYNSVMRSCILLFKSKREAKREGKVIFIDAENEFERKGIQNFLTNENILKIVNTFKNFKTIKEFSYVATNNEILKNDAVLNISLYVKKTTSDEKIPLENAVKEWHLSSKNISKNFYNILLNRGKNN